MCTLVLPFSGCERQPLEATRESPPQRADPPIPPPSRDTGVIVYREVPDWPVLPAHLELGEVAGVDVDAHGHLFVFHRATRGWDTFTRTPIREATVLQFDADTGELQRAWGADRFRLPHGLAIDAEHNVWLTDAALHQVFKFSHDGEPLLGLGEAGIARWDRAHFNRPTDVAFGERGEVYVSDGYENQRVVRFTTTGRYLGEWGRFGNAADEFALPHGIARNGGRLYVADRENNRIAAFDSIGGFEKAWSPVERARVYAVAFDREGCLYAAVRNDLLGIGGVVRLDANGRVTHGIGAVTLGDGQLLSVHDLAIDGSGAIYIAETRAGGLRKFVPTRVWQQ